MFIYSDIEALLPAIITDELNDNVTMQSALIDATESEFVQLSGLTASAVAYINDFVNIFLHIAGKKYLFDDKRSSYIETNYNYSVENLKDMNVQNKLGNFDFSEHFGILDDGRILKDETGSSL